jgi:hypothetical protein
VRVDIGFAKEAPVLGIFGMNVYHKNRLIMVTTLSVLSYLFIHFLIVVVSIMYYIAWIGSQHVGRVYLSLLRTWYVICNDNWRSMTPGGPVCQSD